MVGSLPTMVQAEDENPVDLELGGEGATSWNIGNIKPGDNGTKVVELHNAGTKPGFVTLWVSDIISSEGLNPESETGNTAEPGELANHLLLDISSNRTSTNLKLPTTIYKLPQSVTSPNYLEIIPLKPGDTANLQWKWSLPTQTDNDAQGDGISFTINYLLRECNITDVSNVVTKEGVFTEKVTIRCGFGVGKVIIEKSTVGQTKEGKPISEMWVTPIDKEPPPPSSKDAVAIGLLDVGPHGSTFDRPVTITLAYDPADLPERASEEDLFIATWDEDAGKWIGLEGSAVNEQNRTVSAQVTHFSRFTILVSVPPPPPPRRPSPPPVIIVKKEAEVIKPVLRVNILGEERTVEVEGNGTLRESLLLTDPSGHFILEVDGGSRIISSDDVPITRMDITKTEESIALPDDTVALSSIYEVTGYINEIEVASIIFDPSARLTILYDPRDLPENTFPPFIANYTEQKGWVPLESPPDSLFEVGKAKALIRHASLFTALAELALPPPPLPAEFKVSNLTINPVRAQLGETVTIRLTIANVGAVTGSYEMYLIINGIVRAVKEIILAGNSIETVSFGVSNLAPGKHQVKVAGLTGEFQIVGAEVIFPTEATIGWLLTDLSVGVVIATGLFALYLLIRRSQRLQQSYKTIDNMDNIAKMLRHRNEE